MNKLIPRINGYGDYARVYAQTLVLKVSVYNGSQSVLFAPTVVKDSLRLKFVYAVACEAFLFL